WAKPEMKYGWRCKRTSTASTSSPQPSWSAWPRSRESWDGARRWRCASIPMSTLGRIPTSPPGCARTSSALLSATPSGFMQKRRRCPRSRWWASAATSARNSLVVDAAMNDLVRPALYDAWHEVRTVREPQSGAAGALYDIVGPICETGDFLARDRALKAKEGDLLAVMSSGAYAMSMASNYNSRPRAAEVMVQGSAAELVRARESAEQLFALERIPG